MDPSPQAADCDELNFDPERATAFEALVQASDIGVVVSGADGQLLFMNPSAEFLLGTSISDATEGLLGSLHIDSEMTNANLIAADGSIRFVELRTESTIWGGMSANLLTIKDVSVYCEAAFEAKATVRQRDEFLAALSHEIRSPLSAITSAFQLMQGNAFDPETCKQLEPIVQTQLTQVRSLLDDLLDVSRDTRGKLKIEEKPVDLQDVIQASVAGVRFLVEEHQHELLVKVPDQPLPVVGDSRRLQQVVTNLLTNACKYTPQAGQIRVEVSCDQQVGNVVINVIDNGVGLSPQEAASLFQAFAQHHRTANQRSGGIGLGLNLSKRFIELHSGTIAVASPGPDKGTKFTVTLPLSSRSTREAQEDLSSSSPSCLKILLVEDQRAIREISARLLKSNGHSVATASNGAEAYDALSGDDRFDLALVDLSMPVMDGCELVRKVKSELSLKTIFVAVTGHGQEEDRIATHEAGFDSHLVKPIDIQEVNSLIVRSFDQPTDSGKRQ